ncbi:MAG: GGDEF domain-containing protein [Acidobacteria bacterium]|nr:GGDEF domain-containing protein [Acidobacteriota bacterium]
MVERQVEQRTERLQQEIKALDGRDLQLWSIGLLMILVVAAGFVALILPNVMWGLGELRVAGRYLPQLFFGFISLIVLFNVYAFHQRWLLRNTREELVRQLVRGEAAEQLAMMDPLTGVFNRRYLDEVLPKEINRAERLKHELAFIMIDVDGFKSVNTRFGHVVGDQVLTEVAHVLKGHFRLSDSIIRYGGDEFLVLMVDTDEHGGQVSAERLQGSVDRWNAASVIPGYKMSLSCGVATFAKGASPAEAIEAADQRMYHQKLRNSPVV